MAVRIIGKRLYLEFRCYLPDGRRVKCTESSGLEPTKKNLAIVKAKEKAISYELRHGRFDYLHFFPHGSKAKHFRGTLGNRMSFGEFWGGWVAEKSIRRSTRANFDSSYRHQIAPYFAHMMLGEITEHHILMFRRHLEETGLRVATINARVRQVCMALLHAHRRRLIPAYPCQEVKRLVEPQVDIEPFTFDELNHLLEVLRVKRPIYHDMLTLWAHTGLRPGELFALKWRSVDYFNRKLMIRETRYTGVDGPPKTNHSVRDVDLAPAAYEALKSQEARTGLQGGYIFLNEVGAPFSQSTFRVKFQTLLRMAGLKQRPPKQMRHTFATLAIAVGENISWVSRMLGHSTVEITLKRYNRFVPNLTRRDGSLLGEKLAPEGRKGEDLAKEQWKLMK
jgi:integrase